MLPTSQTSPRTVIPVTIETLAGTSFELHVSPYEQIQSIKRKIERREGIPSSQQHLVFKSNELDDESCLNDYNVEAGTTLKLVLAMRGGPVNTRRVPIEDSLIRDMSEYIDSSRDDCGISSDLVPSSSSAANKNVTFLVLRDGDQFNFFQVIDRDDGTLSPLSGSMSAASMYNTHEPIAVEPELEYDVKRQDDDRKTKQKMELIRSKLKTHARKDVLLPPRPPSSSKPTKSNLIHHHRRNIHIETNPKLHTTNEHISGTLSSASEQTHRPLSYSFSTNLFNTYNLLSTTSVNRSNLLHDEDSDDDDDSQDDEDEQMPSSQQPIFASRSFSPSVYYHKKHHHHHHHHHHQHNTTKKLLSQETATTTTTTTAANATNSNSSVMVDYLHRLSPTIPIVLTSSRILSATKCLNTSDEPISSDEKNDSTNEILYHHSHTSPMLELIDDEIISPTNLTRKPTADIQSRNETSLSKPLWTDDDDQINGSDEYTPGERTSTSQSILFCHPNSSTAITPMPTLPQVIKKPSLPSTTQQFYHHHKPLNNEHQQRKSSPRPFIPLTLSKYRRISSNVHLTTTSSQQPTSIGANSHNASNELINSGSSGVGRNSNNADSFNEHLMVNKRIELLKTPGKHQSTAPSPASLSNTAFPSPPPPPPPPSKRHFAQQDIKSIGTTTTVPTPSSSLLPTDSTKVTIETIGPKTVSALLRQNATIEPVDTSRGVGRHLVSLLTTASKETTATKHGYKQASRDAIIEERYKLDSKLNNPWSSTSSIHSSLQSTTTTAYNTNKLPPVIINRKSTSKCFLCKKKTGLATTYQCRCGSSFCSEHRYPEAHACAFDYKAEGKRLIERNNPLVTAPKLPKI